MNKLVSIIMPAHNSETTISSSINSVLNQSYNNWELLIILDNCTDSTNDIVSEYSCKYSKKIFVYSIDNNSNGVCGARNLGIKLAKGAYISFLDSDDMWLKDKLTKQIDFMMTNGYSFTYSDYYVKKKSNKIHLFKAPMKATYKSLIYSNYVGCLTVIYDKNQLGKIYMPEKAIKREDYATWLFILKKGILGYNVGLPLAVYNVSCGSLSSNKIEMIRWQWNVYKNVENFSFCKSCYLTFISTIRKLLKY